MRVRPGVQRRAAASCRALDERARARWRRWRKPGDLVVSARRRLDRRRSPALVRPALAGGPTDARRPPRRTSVFAARIVKPARKRGGLCVARGCAWRACRCRGRAGLYAGLRAVTVVAGSTSSGVDRIIVRGNHRLSSGEVLALLDGLRGREHVWPSTSTSGGAALLSSPWVRGRVASADAAVDGRRDHPRAARRSASAASTARCSWSTTAATVIDEYGPNYADLDLPIIDGLSAVAGRRTHATSHRALLVRRAARCAPACGTWPSRISQIDVSDARNAVVLLDGDPTLDPARQRAVSSSGCSRISSWRRRCASGCRRSTTSICDSTSGSMSGPSQDAGHRPAQRGPATERTNDADGVRGAMASRERYLVGLDIGTSKVAAIVGEMMDDGSLEIIGIGVAEVERHPARRRRQPRGGGRVHQDTPSRKPS